MTIDEDINEVRGIALRMWEDGNLGAWLMASAVLLGFRLAKRLGAR